MHEQNRTKKFTTSGQHKIGAAAVETHQYFNGFTFILIKKKNLDYIVSTIKLLNWMVLKQQIISFKENISV